MVEGRDGVRGGKRAALVVLLLAAALVVATALMSVDAWQDRSNPSVVNQPPAVQSPATPPPPAS